MIYGVRIEDRQGQALAQIEELCTESTLLSLLFDSQELGVVVLDKPAGTVVLRDDGSNLEDVLSSWLAQSSSSDACPRFDRGPRWIGQRYGRFPVARCAA